MRKRAEVFGVVDLQLLKFRVWVAKASRGRITKRPKVEITEWKASTFLLSTFELRKLNFDINFSCAMNIKPTADKSDL